MATTEAKPRRNGACPTFFKALCRTASEGARTGGYYWAGKGLAPKLDDLAPAWMEDEDWIEGPLAALGALLKRDDRAGALGWLDREIPRCMELVPRRSRERFLDGLIDGLVDEGWDLALI